MTEPSHQHDYEVPTGSEAEGRAWLGRSTEMFTAEHPTNTAMVKHYCALTEDANTHYWDPPSGVPHWGTEVTPPGMLTTWLMPIRWNPSSGRPSASRWLAPRMPLPGDRVINVRTETSFRSPIPLGRTLRAQEELVDVSPRRETRLGPGYFVTTLVRYFTDDDEEVVAESYNTLLRYESVAPEGEDE